MRRRPIIGRWSANVSYLLAYQVSEGGGVWVSCNRCGIWKSVNLTKLVIEKNPLLSLWNRRPICKGCKMPLTFHARHAPGARVIPLITDEPDYTNDLHRAWKREQRRLQGYED